MSNIYANIIKFIFILILIGIILELAGFSEIYASISNEQQPTLNIIEDPHFLISIDSDTINENTAIDSIDDNNDNIDWFDSSKWPLTTCPYYENICIYNQRFRVFNKDDEFSLKPNITPSNIFGTEEPNINESIDIFFKNIKCFNME